MDFESITGQITQSTKVPMNLIYCKILIYPDPIYEDINTVAMDYVTSHSVRYTI